MTFSITVVFISTALLESSLNKFINKGVRFNEIKLTPQRLRFQLLQMSLLGVT